MSGNKLSVKDHNTLLGILAILFWGSTFAFSRSLTEQLGVITAGGLVFIFSGLLSSIYLAIKSPESVIKMIHLPINYLCGCGILFLIYMTTLYLAIGIASSRQQVIEISIVNYLWPGLTLLFSVPILKKQASLAIVPGIIIGFIGIYIAMNPYYSSISMYFFLKNIKNSSLPYILALIAAISWALYSNLVRKWAAAGNGGAVPIFLFITGLFLLMLRIFFKEESTWSIRVILELVYMVIFPTFLAYSFWDQAMRCGDILLVASLSYLTPILSILISSIYLQINININLWIASILVVIGALISRYSISES